MQIDQQFSYFHMGYIKSIEVVCLKLSTKRVPHETGDPRSWSNCLQIQLRESKS